MKKYYSTERNVYLPHDEENTEANTIIRTKKPDYWHLHQSYAESAWNSDDHTDVSLSCSICGNDKFEFGAGHRYTVIKCVVCGTETGFEH